MSFNRSFRNGDNRPNSYQPNNQRPMQRMTNVSPWEGGIVPSARPSNSQGLLSLPTSQLQHNATNLISAQQLVLASSLLSSLGMNVLPNQQQQQQQRISQLQFQQAQQRNDNLPALLRMSRSQIGSMSNSQPSFRQQGQYNDNKFNNVPGDRFRNVDTMRNRMQQHMTNNRTEPYSKNRPQQSSLQQQQRRNFVNKPRVDRKQTASNKPSTAAVPEAAGQKSKFQKPVKVAESSYSAPAEQEVKSKTVDDPVSEAQIISSDGDLAKSTNGENEEVMKVEKKSNGIETVVDPLCTAVKEELDTSTVAVSEEPNAEDINKGAGEKIIVFQCHICNLDMNTSKLLQEHVQLESHKTMMEKTSESYRAQTAALRLNMQEAYGRTDSMNRNKRHDQHHEFCKMCKLHFSGSIASHRKLKEHLQLKTFLHPRCLPCSKEFTTRIEWDSHKLTAAHQTQEQAGLAKAAAKAAAGLGSPKKRANEVERRGYQPQRVYGYHYVSEGFFCRICEKFFDKRPLSRSHLQSKEHYDLCIAFEAKEKEKKSQDNAEKTESCADLESVRVEIKPEADNSIAEPSVAENDVQAEPESEGSTCKRQKLSEDVEDEKNVPASEKDPISSNEKVEQSDATEEENLMLASESGEIEGEDTPEIDNCLLEDDINMILEESGLDLGSSNTNDVKEEGAKPTGKARRGGRSLRGRKRK